MEKNKLPILVPPPTQEDLQLQRRVPKMRIVVDAGHGGRDRSTVGRDGLLEKDLVLEIGQRLAISSKRTCGPEQRVSAVNRLTKRLRLPESPSIATAE